jgi:hypothetical protein
MPEFLYGIAPSNSWSNWTAGVILNPGTNTISAYAVDTSSNASSITKVTFNYIPSATLVVHTNGNGTFSPTNNSPLLAINTNYTLTASAGKNWIFSNWVASGSENLISTNPILKFTMQPNLVLTANFVTNVFLAVQGTYNGLFSVANDVSVLSSGLLKGLTVATNGTYSGKLYIGATNYGVSGSFDVAGNATNRITRGSGLGSLVLGMNLNWNVRPPQVTGTVTGTNGGLWTASLLAELAGGSAHSAEYTLLLPPGANGPSGDGYALLTNQAGTVNVIGALADGATFSESIALSEAGGLAIYAVPYTNGGLLLGRLGMTNGSPEGDLNWIRPPAAGTLFPKGFTNLVSVESSIWTNPPTKTPAMPLTNAELVVSTASLALSFHVAVSSSNTLEKLGGLPTNTLTGSINPANGFLTVSFGNGNGGTITTGFGAVLQNTTNGGGYFVTKTNYGSISLQNEPVGIAPIIFQQPAGQNFAGNGTVHFSVGAAGSKPLSYQWIMDGHNLSDGANISGSTNSLLTVGPESLTNAGSYSVVVANNAGSVTSSIVVLAVSAPTLTIKSPKPNSTVMTSALTVQGTAAGKYGVANVPYQLNSGTWTQVTNKVQWTNWSATVTLQGGTNIFQACSVDPIGNPSPIQRLSLFYLTQSPLTLLTTGFGTISHNFTGNNLVVGTNYTVTAVPSSGSAFSDWTGTVTTKANPLTFLMESNMALTANFVVTNVLQAKGGTYNGLFFPVTPSEQTSGMIKSLTLAKNGIYTGRLFIGGTNYSLGGSFDSSGLATEQIASALGTLSLVLNLDTNLPLVTGTLAGTDGGSWTASLQAESAGSGLGSAEYTVLLPPGTNPPSDLPSGNGYLLITNHAGNVTLIGALADGTVLSSENVAESEMGGLPVYASPYTNGGLLLGRLNMTGASPEGDLIWIRPSTVGGLFPNGFTNLISVGSSLWTNPPASTPAVKITNGTLAISDDGFSLIFPVKVSSTNTLVKLADAPTNSLSGSINLKTGLLSLTFGNGNGTNTTMAVGAVLQNRTNAGGFFLTPTTAGSINLQP